MKHGAMLKPIIVTTVLLLFGFASYAQSFNKRVFTSDIDRFWMAYDSIQATNDSLQQLHFIRSIYINKGTKGLKAFMQARDYDAALWVNLIRRYPKFWRSIRPNTVTIKRQAGKIDSSLQRLKSLYPHLKKASIYFTIGGLRSGGTTVKNMVLIGAEIATGDATTVVSEFGDGWLAGVFAEQQTDNIVPLNIHEYVHTQQSGRAKNLLAQAIKEGSCDFITELVMGKPLQTNYLNYGRLHEEELRPLFKEQMFLGTYGDWLYNGSNAKTVADLGYFMGYAICHAYYTKSSNKRRAVKTIIELNYSSQKAINNFLAQSQYFKEEKF